MSEEKKELTPQEAAIQAAEQKLEAFVKEAKATRGGHAFKVEIIQYDGFGNPFTIKGTVTTKDEKGEAKTIPMVWNLQGRAYSQNIAFDIVVEKPFPA